MAKIYRRAPSCIIYLGEEDEYSRSALQVIQAFWDDVAIDQCIGRRGERGKARDLIMRRMDTFTEGQKNALSVLLARRYFSRVWILQEVILARTVVCVLGSIVFDFDIVLYIGMICKLANRDYTVVKLDDFTIGKSHYSGRHYSDPSPYQTAIHLGILGKARLALQQRFLPHFLELVPMALACDTSDERDRIYGILAVSAELLHHDEPTIVVDYNRSVDEVYANATASLALRRNDLEFLSLVGEQKPMQARDLPTWCPDYSTADFWIRPLGGASQWHIGPIWTLSPNIDFENDRILISEGTRYDSLAEVAIAELLESSKPHVNPDPKTKPRDLLVMVANLPMGCADKSSTRTTTRLEMLWRLLFKDEFLDQRPAPPVTGLFLPHIILQMLCYYLQYQGSDRLLSKETFVTEELASLERIIDEICHLEPGGLLFLPDISSIKVPTMVHDIALAHFALLESLPRRAADAGLDSELKALIPPVPGRGDRTADTAWRYFLQRDIFAPFIAFVSRQSYFSTAQNERLGIGYSSIEVGDEIWLLNGHSAPVILRQLANGNYRFLGETYIQGMMGGELAEELKATNFQVQRIRIE